MGLTSTVTPVSYGPNEAVGRFIKCKRGLKEEWSNGNTWVNRRQIRAEALGLFSQPQNWRDWCSPRSGSPRLGQWGHLVAAQRPSRLLQTATEKSPWFGKSRLPSKFRVMPFPSSLGYFILSILNRPHGVGMQWKKFDLSQANRLWQSQPPPKLSV